MVQEDPHVRIGYGQGEEGTIDAVEESAVAGQDYPAIFDAGAALHGGFREVAKLSRNVGKNRNANRVEERKLRNEFPKIAAREKQGCEHGSDSSLPGLLRTDARRKFMPSELPADVVRADIARPVHDN